MIEEPPIRVVVEELDDGRLRATAADHGIDVTAPDIEGLHEELERAILGKFGRQRSVSAMLRVRPSLEDSVNKGNVHIVAAAKPGATDSAGVMRTICGLEAQGQMVLVRDRAQAQAIGLEVCDACAKRHRPSAVDDT